MYTMKDIIDFLKIETACDNIAQDSDLEQDLGVTGDDFPELMEKYSIAFHVDMTTYLWYFHHNEEGFGGLGQLLFKSPRKIVKHIPITPTLLLEFANTGKWSINYPEHRLPKKRYDIITNQIAATLMVLLIIGILIKKYCL